MATENRIDARFAKLVAKAFGGGGKDKKDGSDG